MLLTWYETGLLEVHTELDRAASSKTMDRAGSSKISLYEEASSLGFGGPCTRV